MPNAHEVLAVLQTNRPPGMSAAELNELAVKALLGALEEKASLRDRTATNNVSGPSISKTEVFDGSITYVRLERVGRDLPEPLSDTLKAVSKTNQTKGVVLDLRFARGDDYKAAADTAELFVSKKVPLLNWGEGMKVATGKPVVDVPVAVLVNEQTVGSPEALAAALREAGAGLIFGSRTAGAAAVPRDVPLSNGRVLRVASKAIELGNGKPMTGGVRPDILIQVSAEDERAYYADAFAVIQKTNQFTGMEATTTNTNGLSGTNRLTRRQRFNEADLVREHNNNNNLNQRRNEVTVQQERQPDAPVVNDPALARALDVLKGLAVVHGKG